MLIFKNKKDQIVMKENSETGEVKFLKEDVKKKKIEPDDKKEEESKEEE